MAIALVSAAAAPMSPPDRSSISVSRTSLRRVCSINNALAAHALPHHGVVAGFGAIVEDVDFLVLVALAHDSALALFEVGRAPGHVDTWCSAVRWNCTLVPVPIFSVLPIRADTSPRLHWANSAFSCAGLRASWTKRTAEAGIPRAASSSLMAR